MSTAITKHRFLTALLVFVSGLALLPLISLQSQSFGWEAFADAYIFVDDFESGDETAWSLVAPRPPQLFELPESSNSTTVSFRPSAAILEEDLADPFEVLAGFVDLERRAFSVEVRRRRSLELRAKMRTETGKWATTEWEPLGKNAGVVEVEWRRAMGGAEDGALYLSIGGELRLWLTDLDTAADDLRYLGLVKLGEVPAVNLLPE